MSACPARQRVETGPAGATGHADGPAPRGGAVVAGPSAGDQLEHHEHGQQPQDQGQHPDELDLLLALHDVAQSKRKLSR